MHDRNRLLKYKANDIPCMWHKLVLFRKIRNIEIGHKKCANHSLSTHHSDTNSYQQRTKHDKGKLTYMPE